MGKEILNVIYDEASIGGLAPFLEIVKRYPNPPTGPDGPIKWASMLDALDVLAHDIRYHPDVDNISILDIGSGNSALPLMISDLGFKKIKCVDAHNIHPDVKSHSSIEWTIGNAFDFINKLPDGSLDYAVDSCAVIHFETTSLLAPNDGLLKISQLLLKKLRVGGKFIIVTDCIPEIGGLSGEFINYNMIIDCVRGPDTTSGFKLVGDSPSTPIDTFLQKYSQNGRSYDLGIVRLVFEKV